MSKRKEIKASDLRGINVYQDSKKGTVIYDWLTGNGYQITTSETNTYIISQSYLPIALLLGYGFYYFLNNNLILSVIIGVIAYIGMQLIYRFTFLYKLPVIKKYQRPGGKNLIKNLSIQYSSSQLKVLSVLCICIVITGIISIFTQDLQSSGIILMIIMCLVATIMTIVFLTCIFIKNKQ